MVGEWAWGWHTYGWCWFRYRCGWVVEVSHYMRLRLLESERATQVVNETPTPSIIGVLWISNVVSDTRQCDSDGTRPPFFRVRFSRVSLGLVDPTLENDDRFYDARHY